jgi:hypothetical protein
MNKFYLVSVNMGYGHQRAAFPLKEMSVNQEIIQANDYNGIPEKDRKIWLNTRKGYELISKLKKIPLIGQFIFFLFDQIQKILIFYPKRDLSKPSLQLTQTFNLIKKGWGRDLIEKLIFKQKNEKKFSPFVSTFFVPAFMAEYFNYPGEIFCLICDTDISRAWAPLNPESSRIKYFASTERTVERLKLYGVKKENIFLTGFPLPLENIGSQKLEFLKQDLKTRLINLDPKKRFFKYYQALIKSHLSDLSWQKSRALTIMFAVGGAGTQKEIGLKIIRKLADKIKKNQVKVILSAGTNLKIKRFFEKKCQGLDVEIIFKEKFEDYFHSFNQALRKTDILWTKPSELSFYSALGLPIIIAPPVGSQEKFNKRWLLKSGFGLAQENPEYLDQWLFDWLEKGYLAEAAMQGFIEAEKKAIFNIEKIIKKTCSG